MDGIWARSPAVCQHIAATTGTGEVILDVDASLHQVHSERKEDTAPSYKGGFGYHPLYVSADATGKVLAVKLRPGNAGANTIADHFEVLDAAIAQLPAEIAIVHHPGDDTGLVKRRVLVRSDSDAGPGLAAKCRERNLEFSFVAATNTQTYRAMMMLSLRSVMCLTAYSVACAQLLPGDHHYLTVLPSPHELADWRWPCVSAARERPKFGLPNGGDARVCRTSTSGRGRVWLR